MNHKLNYLHLLFQARDLLNKVMWYFSCNSNTITFSTICIPEFVHSCTGVYSPAHSQNAGMSTRARRSLRWICPSWNVYIHMWYAYSRFGDSRHACDRRVPARPLNSSALLSYIRHVVRNGPLFAHGIRLPFRGVIVSRSVDTCACSADGEINI